MATAEPEAEITAEPEVESESEVEPTSESEVLNAGLAEPEGPPAITLLLPALIGISTLIIVVVTCSQMKRRKLKKQYISSTGEITRPWRLDASVIQPYVTSMISQSDLQVLCNIALFPYSTSALMYMCLPSLLSLAFLPVGTFMRRPAIALLWPDGSFHDAEINDVISCFLIPAGLVYAISFGFAFQQAASSQDGYRRWLATHYVIIRRHVITIGKLHHIDVSRKLEMLQLVKNSLISCCKSLMGHKEEHTYEASDDLFEVTSRLCDMKEELEARGCSKTQLDFCDQITDFTSQLQTQVNIIHGLRSDMNACLWTFLELLGYFAFIGILLVDAKSYRMELAMCFCTVFSISMFSYILGDLDHPFHGLFRVRLTPLFEMSRLLEEKYMELASTAGSAVSFKRELSYIRSTEHVTHI